MSRLSCRKIFESQELNGMYCKNTYKTYNEAEIGIPADDQV